MKKTFYVQMTIVLLLVWASLSSCGQSKAEKEKAEFDAFIERFTTDYDFQMDHVKFPLEEFEINGEKVTYTQDYWLLTSGFLVGTREEENFHGEGEFLKEDHGRMVYKGKGIFLKDGKEEVNEDTFVFECIDGEWFVVGHTFTSNALRTMTDKGYRGYVAINNQVYRMLASKKETFAQSESFDDFLKRFKSDADFQFSRIKFPVGTVGLYKNESDTGPTQYPYTKDIWELMIGEDQFGEGENEYGSDVYTFKEKTDNKVVWRHDMYYARDGFDQITFERVDGVWYVTDRQTVYPHVVLLLMLQENVKEANKKYTNR